MCKQIIGKNESEVNEARMAYRNYLKGIVLKTSVTSTFENSKKLALRKSEMAVDVLKCFLAGHSLYPPHAIPELTHRKTNLQQHLYWVSIGGNTSLAPQFQNLGGFIPFPLNAKFIADIEARGFDYFSNFIKKNHTDDLYCEIGSTINRFAQIVSTLNNHEKTAKAIFLVESCILQRSNGKGKGETKITTHVLPKLTSTQLDLFISVFKKGYRIRDAYVHNGLELPLDANDLHVLLEIVRRFIQKLITVHTSGKRNFEDIQTFFVG